MAILVAAVAAYNGGGHACGLVLNCSKFFFKKEPPKNLCCHFGVGWTYRGGGCGLKKFPY